MLTCPFCANTILAMLILPGCSALSAFRSHRLLSQLKELDAAVVSVTARYVHFIDAAAPIAPDDVQRLDALLTYGDPFTSAVCRDPEAGHDLSLGQ